MENAVIYLVTNRSGDFRHPSLASCDRYTPIPEAPDEIKLRALLRLNDTSTDYYVMGALMAVYAFPDILAEYRETGRSFEPTLWEPDEDVLTGGAFRDTSQDAFYLHRVPDEWPVAMSWDIAFMDATTALVTVGDARYRVPVRASGGSLYATWPEALGLRGAVDLDGSWTSGATLHLEHVPVSFPYHRAVEKVMASPGSLSLISARGYMGAFYSAQSDIEKFALALTALAWPGGENRDGG